MYYTYVIQSKKDLNFYAGYTKDLKLRFEQHNKGVVESTRDRGPFKLVYYEACLHQEDAFRREKYLKSNFGKKYLKSRLKNYFGKNQKQPAPWSE
jgi:putative endonuclease